MEPTSITLIPLHCLPLNKTENILEFGFKSKNFNLAFVIYLLIILTVFIKASNIHRKYETSIIFWCCLLISLMVLPLLLGLAFMFALYKQIVKLILKIKLKDSFGGLLHGSDSVWAIEDQSKSIINILMIIESQYDSEKFYNHIKHSLREFLFENPRCLPKLSATFHQAFGYFYLIKNNITEDNCVKSLKLHCNEEEITKEVLMEYLSELNNLNLPKNHTAFWEILVGDHRVKWRDHNKFYPIIFRVHHSLADGISLLGILTKIFSSNSDQVTQKLTIKGKLQTCARYLYGILSVPAVIFLQISRNPDCNRLHGPALSGQRVLAMKVEDEPFRIEAIKEMKNHLGDGFTFSDILFTVVSASFREYFEKNSPSKPNSLTTVVLSYRYGSADYSNLKLENRFSLAMMNLPVNKCSKSYFRDTLRMVKKETERLKSSNDYQVNYWLLSIVSTLLPVPLLKPLLKSSQSTLIVSNLPGPSSMDIFGGCKLEDLIFWIPHRGSTGVGVSVLSYDGRLQLGLSVDKALISNENEVQDIIDGIYNNINLMYYEIIKERKGVK